MSEEADKKKLEEQNQDDYSQYISGSLMDDNEVPGEGFHTGRWTSDEHY